MKTENLILTIVIAFLALFVISSLFSGMMGFGSYGYMGGIMGNFGFGFMPFFGWLFMLLIFVALVLFIAWLVKQLQASQRDAKSRRRK